MSPKPAPLDIQIDPGALALMDEFDDACDTKKRSIDPMDARRGFVSRYAQIAERIALVSGALNDQRISVNDVQFAISLLEAIEHNSSLIMPQLDTENQHDANTSRVLAIIRESGLIKASDLYDKSRFLKKPERAEILLSLEEAGHIKTVKDPKTDRPTIYYKFVGKK
jgi:hypothetical protein